MWTTDDTRLDYESLIIFTLVEEDGELKIDNFKDFQTQRSAATFTAGSPKLWIRGQRRPTEYTRVKLNCALEWSM